MGRPRPINHPAPDPPPPYTPPILPVLAPHPDVSRRTSSGHSTREILLPVPDGVRAIAYGEQWLAGKLQYATLVGADLWYVLELCAGECDGLIDVTEAGKPLRGNMSYWWYAGTPAGTVDTNLAAVDATWNEAFAGTCYAVVRLINFGVNWKGEIPNLLFHQRCRQPLNPDTGTRIYSTNPWDHFYDFLLWSEGKALPSTRVNTAAFTAAKAADVAASRSNTAHLLLLEETEPDDVIKTFCLLLDAFWFWDANQYLVVPDRVKSSAATLTSRNVSRSVEIEGERDDIIERPNVVVLWWTDVSNGRQLVPLRLQSAAVTAGTEDPIEVEYRLPHIHDSSIAAARGWYLLNSYVYDLKVRERWNITTAARQLGDRVTRTINARGLTFDGILVGRTKLPNNTYDVQLLEYNALKYSSSAVTNPALTPSSYPDPSSTPPDITAGAITEELYTLQSGVTANRGRLVFTPPVYPFFEAVEIWVSIAGGEYRLLRELKGVPAGVQAITYLESLEDLRAYAIKLYVRSIYQTKSAGVTLTFTPQGKVAPPSNVLSINAGISGDKVYLSWQAAQDIDLEGYEIRRGSVGDTWASAKFVGVFYNLTAVDTPPPNSSNTLRYFVKAFDAGLRYSTTAAQCDVTLPASAASLQGQEIDFWPYCGSSSLTGYPTYDGKWASTFVEPVAGQLVLGTGDLVLEDVGYSNNLPVGVDIARLATRSIRAFLSRALDPNGIDTECTANGYTTLQQWETSLDIPRKTYRGVEAPIWAPLPANSSGEIWGNHNFDWGSNFRNTLKTSANGNARRMKEVVLRLLKSYGAGADFPETQARADAMLLRVDTGEKFYEPGMFVGPNGDFLAPGVRLSTNSPYYQMVVESVPNPSWTQYTTGLAGGVGRDDGALWGITFSGRSQAVKAGGVTTDASGYAIIDLTAYCDANPTISTTQQFDIQLTPVNTGAVIAVVDTFDYSGLKQVRIKTITTSTGALAPSSGVNVRVDDSGKLFGFAGGAI